MLSSVFFLKAKGYDTSRHVLACFGGAGGQHACAIARSLGISTVFIHKYAGILSAYGMALADVIAEAQEPSVETYNHGDLRQQNSFLIILRAFLHIDIPSASPENFARLDDRLDAMEAKVRSRLRAQGFVDSQIKTEPFLHLRYEGTDCALMCTPSNPNSASTTTRHGDFLTTFLER